jgi:hypothetical protein
MIISNSRRFIFVHVMKAAGTSITRALEPGLAWNDLVLGGTELGERLQEPYRARYGLHKHSRAAEIREVVGSERWEEYLTFAVVRHPYARAVSLYTFAERIVREQGRARWLRWLRFHPASRSGVWRWHAVRAYLATRGFSGFIRHREMAEAPGMRPQRDWVVDAAGRQIVEVVGRVESLAEDLGRIAPRLGLDAGAVGRHNPSGAGGPGRHLRDEADYRWLEERFRPDFEMFGYDPALRYG